jgi:hypothetical protein
MLENFCGRTAYFTPLLNKTPAKLIGFIGQAHGKNVVQTLPEYVIARAVVDDGGGRIARPEYREGVPIADEYIRRTTFLIATSLGFLCA